MNNNYPKFNGGNENYFNSFENNNGFGNDNLLNQNSPVTSLTKPIRVSDNANDFKTKTNPPFNSSYISKALEINGTEVKPQHNKPIYQPFVMPIMANPMNAMGMGAYNPMMMGYPQMFPYPMMPQFPMMMGYPQMSQYPGMLTYPPMAGPEVEQQLQGMQQQSASQGSNFNKKQYAQDPDRHFAIMNPDLMKQQQQQQGINSDFDESFDDTFNEGPPFGANHDFNQTNEFGGGNFAGQNDFGQGNTNFGPTPDFNAAPSFSSSPDFVPSDGFNNSNVLGKIDSTKMLFQYDEETTKRKLPVWAIVLIVVLLVLVLAVITIVMLYFNLEAVHNLINGWFGLEIPFNPWF
ncbi:hypothetical protein [Spiroplasma citri]|uniref:hypothetical protein n=1 Tax=Spiroplasma citri TaxID=2133 RepID=UPI000903FAD3|nr:hypothetical protein [Spiroplasma citri]APE74423.1 hypothetical protein SCITRI_00524 [Spiroplasma citri]QIA74649.1 hypothetical protein GTU57_02410 [Spiroplasma citri]